MNELQVHNSCTEKFPPICSIWLLNQFICSCTCTRSALFGANAPTPHCNAFLWILRLSLLCSSFSPIYFKSMPFRPFFIAQILGAPNHFRGSSNCLQFVHILLQAWLQQSNQRIACLTLWILTAA